MNFFLVLYCRCLIIKIVICLKQHQPHDFISSLIVMPDCLHCMSHRDELFFFLAFYDFSLFFEHSKLWQTGGNLSKYQLSLELGWCDQVFWELTLQSGILLACLYFSQFGFFCRWKCFSTLTLSRLWTWSLWKNTHIFPCLEKT